MTAVNIRPMRVLALVAVFAVLLLGGPGDPAILAARRAFGADLEQAVTYVHTGEGVNARQTLLGLSVASIEASEAEAIMSAALRDAPDGANVVVTVELQQEDGSTQVVDYRYEPRTNQVQTQVRPGAPAQTEGPGTGNAGSDAPGPAGDESPGGEDAPQPGPGPGGR
ncbi:MAG: hypothetical protein QMC79_03775 [Anaerosomatales bacterium]|nr:hypothetical protein [Anaerosomatales bacterium]